MLALAVADSRRIDDDAYREFRQGLLRHIAMEEKVLFAELKLRDLGRDLIKALHADHAAIASILVPPPTHALMQQIPPVRASQHLDEPRIHDHIERMLAARDALRK